MDVFLDGLLNKYQGRNRSNEHSDVAEEDSGDEDNSDVSSERLREAGYDSEGMEDEELELQQRPQPQASKDSGIPYRQ
jgi:hypothetical protein